MTSDIQPGKFAYGLLDLSKDQDFRFSENPKVVQQTDKTYHKKPGRKPLTNIPDSKRKAQILTAQRAFRERKKYYVEDLEKRVKACESSHTSAISLLQKELLQLKEYLNKLETENKVLRSIERNSNASFGSPRNPHINPNSNYGYCTGNGSGNDSGSGNCLSSDASSEETFRGIPNDFDFTQLSNLGGPPVSSSNEAILPIPEGDFSPCNSTSIQDFPTSKAFNLVDCLPNTSPEMNLLPDNLNSELITLTDSYSSSLASAFSTYPKTSASSQDSQKYLTIESGQPLYCPNALIELQSSTLNRVENPNHCKSSASQEGKLSCCGLAAQDFPDQFSEVPCIPKSRNEAALCESLTCVAIGVPATTVSTERLVLELEENATQLNESSDQSSISKPCSRRKYLSARDVWEQFATNPEFANLSIDCLCKQLKSKVKVLHGCSGEKMHVVIAEDEVSAAFERLHVGNNQ